MRKMRKKVLKTITIIAAIMFTLSVCTLDSDSCIPIITAFICEGWLALMAYANKDLLGRYYG